LDVEDERKEEEQAADPSYFAFTVIVELVHT
jgi:hypothetical protein